jgi:hypothetical protein
MRYPNPGVCAPFELPIFIANGDEKVQYQTGQFCATQRQSGLVSNRVDHENSGIFAGAHG